MKSIKSLSTIEAITHFDGPKFNGERKKRCYVSNIKEATLVSYGYLRKDDFYPLDIANIVAKYLTHYRLIMTFKQSVELVGMKKDFSRYDEANQRRTVLFTPDITQLPFIQDINRFDTAAIDKSYHINFDFKMLHHDCDVRNGAWYSNNGYFIQCGVIKIPKIQTKTKSKTKTSDYESNYNPVINKFGAIDAKQVVQFGGGVEFGKLVKQLVPKANIEAEYVFLAVYDSGTSQSASIGHNSEYNFKMMYSNHNGGRNNPPQDTRYVLKTNDSITVSITRKNVSESKKQTNVDDDKNVNDNCKYNYSISWMKNCDKNNIFLDQDVDKGAPKNVPLVMQLDCEKNDYFIAMTSVACACDTQGFEFELNIC